MDLSTSYIVILAWLLVWSSSVFCGADDFLLSNFGVVLDGNDEGTQVDIFTWSPRVFDSPYPIISVPFEWSVSQRVGSFMGDECSGSLDQCTAFLSPLIDQAKLSLSVKVEFSSVPVYFLCSGAVRGFLPNRTVIILNTIRQVLSNPTLNPFYFQSDMVRVISGEEQAAYMWASVNLLRGSLIPAASFNATSNNIPLPLLIRDVRSVGIIDLTTDSTEIAFATSREVRCFCFH